jgi:hypothetical protein
MQDVVAEADPLDAADDRRLEAHEPRRRLGHEARAVAGRRALDGAARLSSGRGQATARSSRTSSGETLPRR